MKLCTRYEMPKITIRSTGLKNPTGGIGDTLSSSTRKTVSTLERNANYTQATWKSLGYPRQRSQPNELREV